MQIVFTRWARWALVLLVCVLGGVAALSVRAIRTPILRAAGWALVADEPLEPADIIVVAVDADGPGVLEAADLVRSGIAARVAVFADLPDDTDREFRRRGLTHEDAASRSVRQLESLGIASVERVSGAVAGTEDEGGLLPGWCDERQFLSVVVVSAPDHTRRLRRVLHRSMQGHRTRVTVRFAHYSRFDPDRWWQTRAGIRIEIVEVEKLLLDLVRHPVS
jgi:hypothetical protein